MPSLSTDAPDSPAPTLSDLFAHKPFVRFWFARLAGMTANQMLMVAVAWHMYDITGSAWQLGLVGLCEFLPALLVTLPAGQVVDKHHRGRVFAGCMAAQCVIALTMLAAFRGGWDTRELIYLIAVALGVVRAFQHPSQQAIVPLLVPRPLLQRAIAISSIGTQATVIGGPALGGVIYVWGAGAVYTFCAVFTALATVLTLTVHYVHVRSNVREGWRGLLRGVEFVWQRKVLLGATSLDLFAVLLGGAVALLPIFARDILHTGPTGLGFLRAAPAVGALSMSLALARWPLQRHVGAKLLGAVGVFGLATVVFGFSHSFVLSLVALAVTGAADNISVVTRSTLVQLETPDEMRGRVAAVNSVFIGASNQLGEFESGAAATLMGPVGAVVFGGVGCMLVAGLWFKLFPDLARRDRMTG